MAGNFSNGTDRHAWLDAVDWRAMEIIGFFFYGIYIALGTFLNLGFLAAILTSSEMRSTFRNKMVCGILLGNLSDSAIVMPLYIIVHVLHPLMGRSACILWDMSNLLAYVQDFVGNWSVCIAIASLVACTYEWDPSLKMSPLAFKIGRIALLLFPWLLPSIYIPAVSYGSVKDNRYYCISHSLRGNVFFKVVDSVVPLVSSAILLCLIAIARRRRGLAGGVMKTELIGEGSPQQDSVRPYVGVVAIAMVCDSLFTLLILVYRQITDIRASIILGFVSHLLRDARVVAIPSGLLLFPDIKDRVQHWRPWRKQAAGIDLTINYTRSQDGE
ncbi:uncharacterized protein LOC101851058 [Aplysia californica]|uniref:Uncharacterized protein LOC101851058 n=1 Tax=Aplysia californica TaxID=6500 RepID=A0ABM1A481_APLCA|nr:uncharacterized protein LOC101851058 [Aplysia californica]XP_012940514.1 uncharacterized protein LOC101851058 [Aplysia californica]